MTDPEIVALVASGTLLVNFVAALVGGTWALSRSSNALFDKVQARLDQNSTVFSVKIDELEGRLGEVSSKTSKEFGETAAALRQKINEVEIWGRDHFVDHRTFHLIVGEIKDSWRRFEEKIDHRLDKFDDKLDKRSILEVPTK